MPLFSDLVILALPFIFPSVECIIVQRCPRGWTSKNQSCYKMLSGERLQREEAQARCRGIGGDLVVPGSPEENAFVFNLFHHLTPDPHDRGIWVGRYMIYEEGNRFCSLDMITTSAEYCNLRETSQTSNQCVKLSHMSGDWLDARCNSWKHTMCERGSGHATSLICSAVVPIDRFGSHCLYDHAFFEAPTKHPAQCCLACYNDPSCRSFNLSGGKCQFNNATISQVGHRKSSMKNDPDCQNYEFDSV